jgi:hypothetical protein
VKRDPVGQIIAQVFSVSQAPVPAATHTAPSAVTSRAAHARRIRRWPGALARVEVN